MKYSILWNINRDRDVTGSDKSCLNYLALDEILVLFPLWDASNIALGSQRVILSEHEETTSLALSKLVWIKTP